MDNRLDFYNGVNEHLETLDPENDTFFIFSHNKVNHDLLFNFFGDWEVFSLIFSDENAVNNTDETKELYEDIKRIILNTAINICNNDISHFNKLKQFINEKSISHN